MQAEETEGAKGIAQYAAAFALDTSAVEAYCRASSCAGQKVLTGGTTGGTTSTQTVRARLMDAASGYSDCLPTLLRALPLAVEPARSALRSALDASIERVQALHAAASALATAAKRAQGEDRRPLTLALLLPPTVRVSAAALEGGHAEEGGRALRPLPSRTSMAVAPAEAAAAALPDVSEAESERERLAKAARIRSAVVAEMESSERVYLGHLFRLTNVFARPLGGRPPEEGGAAVAALGTPLPMPTGPTPGAVALLTSREQEALWPGLDALVQLHTMLLKRLTEVRAAHADSLASADPGTAVRGVVAVADLFKLLAPFFKLAQPYCTNYSIATRALTAYRTRPAFNDFLVRAEADPACCGQTLASLLVMPVQRVPRFVLLLSELKKHTPGGSMPEAVAALDASLSVVSHASRLLDTSIAQYERRVRVVEWQRRLHPSPDPSLITPTRELVKEGSLSKLGRWGKVKPYVVALFSDALFLYASKGVVGDGLRPHGILQLRGVEAGGGHNAFRLAASPRDVTMVASSSEDFGSWVEAVDRTLKAGAPAITEGVAAARRAVLSMGPTPAGGGGAPPPPPPPPPPLHTPSSAAHPLCVLPRI